MGRNPELTPTLRARICELHSIGWGYKKIHERYPQVSISGIRHTVKMESTRADQKTLPRSGRPRVITPEQQKQLLEMVAADSEIKMRDLAQALQGSPSVRTVQRLFRTLDVQRGKQPERRPETAAPGNDAENAETAARD